MKTKRSFIMVLTTLLAIAAIATTAWAAKPENRGKPENPCKNSGPKSR